MQKKWGGKNSVHWLQIFTADCSTQELIAITYCNFSHGWFNKMLPICLQFATLYLTLIGMSYEREKNCSSLAPPRGIFYKPQWAWQGVKLNRLMSILTSKKVWKFLIKIQLTKCDPKRTMGWKVPSLMPIRVSGHLLLGISLQDMALWFRHLIHDLILCNVIANLHLLSKQQTEFIQFHYEIFYSGGPNKSVVLNKHGGWTIFPKLSNGDPE